MVQEGDLVGSAQGHVEVEANSRLRKENHSELIVEELVGGRLYTGPMYTKYNAVLRSKSKVPFLVGQAKELTKGNDYVTTIHAISSCVLKLSKLTKAGNVWRGIKDAKLPSEFWVPNGLGCVVASSMASPLPQQIRSRRWRTRRVGTVRLETMTIFEMRMGRSIAAPISGIAIPT